MHYVKNNKPNELNKPIYLSKLLYDCTTVGRKLDVLGLCLKKHDFALVRLLKV